jgi:hypothetical protein
VQFDKGLLRSKRNYYLRFQRRKVSRIAMLFATRLLARSGYSWTIWTCCWICRYTWPHKTMYHREHYPSQPPTWETHFWKQYCLWDDITSTLMDQHDYSCLKAFFTWLRFGYETVPFYFLLRITTSLFSNLHSKLKNNNQYLSIDQCRVLVLICSALLSCANSTSTNALSSDHYAH